VTIVAVPFADPDPVAFEAVKRNLLVQRIPARFDDVGQDEYAYARWFQSLWKLGHDFIIVEHDVLPWPGAITKLEQCVNVWCGLNTSLQCTKFSPSRLGDCPVSEPTHWQMLDHTVFRALGLENFCEHSPEPINLNLLNA
jgi:hypothetical protein